MSEFEVSRHKQPRPDCIDAGWDFPHEGPGLVILVGEYECPACEPRLIQKQSLIMQQELLLEQKTANELKERELYLREAGDWVESTPRVRPTYVLPPRINKGGTFVEPRRNHN